MDAIKWLSQTIPETLHDPDHNPYGVRRLPLNHAAAKNPNVDVVHAILEA